MSEYEPDVSDSALLTGAPDTLTGRDLVTSLLRHRRLIVGLAAAGFVIVALFALGARHYESESSFAPQAASGASSRLSSVAGLAAQFGVVLPSDQGGQSPEYYVQLLTSRHILEQLSRESFPVPTDSGVITMPLYRFFEPKAALPKQLDESYKLLQKSVDASASQTTGIIDLRVSARTPKLAQAMNAALIDLLNQFNRTTRQSQARAEREFTGQRLAEVQASLRGAEDKLEAFQASNATFKSPTLRLEEQRLEREVSEQQDLYMTVNRAYEQARIQEVRDMPVISIIDEPSLPVQPKARGLLVRAVVVAILAGLLGALIGFARDIMNELLSTSSSHDEMAKQLDAARADLRRVLPFMKRRSTQAA